MSVLVTSSNPHGPPRPGVAALPCAGTSMNTLHAIPTPVQDFDEDAWDDLLNYIEEHRVIPIIGPDLLHVQTDNGLRPLYEWLAEKLAVRLSVDIVGLPQPLTLNDVMCCFLGPVSYTHLT